MATLPLHKCRIINLLVGRLRLRRHRLFVNRDRARLGAAVEANAATTATIAVIDRGMHAVLIQVLVEVELLRRTAFHAQSAALALVGVDDNFSFNSHLSPRCDGDFGALTPAD